MSTTFNSSLAPLRDWKTLALASIGMLVLAHMAGPLSHIVSTEKQAKIWGNTRQPVKYSGWLQACDPLSDSNHKFYIQTVLGDGNCFFRAIASQDERYDMNERNYPNVKKDIKKVPLPL